MITLPGFNSHSIDNPPHGSSPAQLRGQAPADARPQPTHYALVPSHQVASSSTGARNPNHTLPSRLSAQSVQERLASLGLKTMVDNVFSQANARESLELPADTRSQIEAVNKFIGTVKSGMAGGLTVTKSLKQATSQFVPIPALVESARHQAAPIDVPNVTDELNNFVETIKSGMAGKGSVKLAMQDAIKQFVPIPTPAASSTHQAEALNKFVETVKKGFERGRGVKRAMQPAIKQFEPIPTPAASATHQTDSRPRDPWTVRAVQHAIVDAVSFGLSVPQAEGFAGRVLRRAEFDAHTQGGRAAGRTVVGDQGTGSEFVTRSANELRGGPRVGTKEEFQLDVSKMDESQARAFTRPILAKAASLLTAVGDSRTARDATLVAAARMLPLTLPNIVAVKGLNRAIDGQVPLDRALRALLAQSGQAPPTGE